MALRTGRRVSRAVDPDPGGGPDPAYIWIHHCVLAMILWVDLRPKCELHDMSTK